MHLLGINGTTKSITQKEIYYTPQWCTKHQIQQFTKDHITKLLRKQPKTHSWMTHLTRYPRTHH